jgi:cell division septation protein DedD
MAKDYGKKLARRQSSNNGYRLAQIFAAIIFFVIGYITASTKIFSFPNVATIFKQYFFQENISIKPAKNKAELPKPKLEFYNLLVDDKVELAMEETLENSLDIPAESKIVDKPLDLTLNNDIKPVAKIQYAVQIASFRNKKDAEMFKNTIASHGFKTMVQQAHNKDGIWYRVLVGRVSSKDAAVDLIKKIAAKEHIKGMVRKIED